MPQSDNTYPILRYAYAISRDVHDRIDWQETGQGSMKIVFTKPRKRLVMKIVRGRDTLVGYSKILFLSDRTFCDRVLGLTSVSKETVTIGDLLARPRSSQGPFIGLAQGSVEAQYSSSQLAISYAGTFAEVCTSADHPTTQANGASLDTTSETSFK